jgi:hypothetical protein
VTIYERLRQLLEDGDWHSEREIQELTTFPEAWIDELRRAPDTIVEEVDGERLVRLAD